jgi:hypothetical protein
MIEKYSTPMNMASGRRSYQTDLRALLRAYSDICGATFLHNAARKLMPIFRENMTRHARRRNKANLFVQYTPRDNLEIHRGFDLTTDRYLYATVGAQNDNNYSPSFGFVYTPLDWLRVFADYNWDRNDWKMDVQDRTALTQTPATNCFPAVPLNQNQCWTSR